MLYEGLSEAMAPHDTGSVASGASRTTSGIKSALEKSAAERASQSTLTPADLAPAWRGPARKDAKHAA
jgi:hypothetical protein